MLEILKTETIENILPHRYENFLVDRCEITPEHFHLFVDIQDQDPLNRDLFLTERDHYKKLNNCILAEVMALAAITCHGKENNSQVAIFASISNFKIQEEFSGSTLKVIASHKSSKQGFFRYSTSIESTSGTGKASAQLMAYATENPESTEGEAKLYTVDYPSFSKMILPIPYKKTALNCINSIEHIEAHRIISAYTYPLAHPFIKGHFPGQPIMMGVMQWMMLEDALYHWAEENRSSLPNALHTLHCDAVIFSEDKTIVCEISGCVLTYQKGEKHSFYIDCNEAKRIFFRSVVKPGSLLFCDLIIKQIDDTKIERST